MAEKSYRDTRDDEYTSRPKDAQVDREVADLIRAKATDYQAMQKLKTKYPNNQDLVDKVHEAYKELVSRIYKRAKKFKQYILDRYGGLGLTQGELIKKAKKYVKKLKLSDPEFDLFYIMITSEKGPQYEFTIPTSKMAKALGYDVLMASSSKLNVPAADQSIVEEIVNKYGETKPLHAQVILQSLTYQDCAPEALTGEFDHKKMSPYAYVHPVIAALFIPKIDLLDEQILMSNIGYIVQRKATEQQIATLPDYKLYWDMIMDPNDTACNITNVTLDLKNRYALQIELWDAVLNLRQGKYYYCDNSGLVKFMRALENCRNVIHDAPDLSLLKDEGTILRRLLSAFSLYPTYVNITKLWGLLMGSQYGVPSSPYESGLGNTTKVPMITLRLPHNLQGAAKPVSLEEAITQPQWFVKGGIIVPQSMQIVHSNEVLFFYVGRRFQSINFARMAVPCNFTNLPMTITGFEQLNEHPVNAPEVMNIADDTYKLKSVVVVEKTQVQGRTLIVGSSAMICPGHDMGRFSGEAILYDPQGAGIMVEEPKTKDFIRNKPITLIPRESPFVNVGGVETFASRARCRGTIFMYHKLNKVGCYPYALN
jgi:hypothetical protein